MPTRDRHLSSPPFGGHESGNEPSAAALTVTLALTDEQLDVLADLVAERLRPAPAECSSRWLNTEGAAAYLVERFREDVASRGWIH
jgi:hypothetical protein